MTLETSPPSLASGLWKAAGRRLRSRDGRRLSHITEGASTGRILRIAALLVIATLLIAADEELFSTGDDT